MNFDSVHVPRSLWKDIACFFAELFAPCKDCMRGNTHTCWNSSCAAFKYRTISRRVASVEHKTFNFPNWVLVENEILSAVRQYGGGPVRPSQIVLESTRSKAVKSATIDRLVRTGRLVESRTGEHSRMISLPKKEPENENNNTNNSSHRCGSTTRRPTARELGAGPSNARRDHRAE